MSLSSPTSTPGKSSDTPCPDHNRQISCLTHYDKHSAYEPAPTPTSVLWALSTTSMQRSQYTSESLWALLARERLTGSTSTVSDAYDNGLMESTIGLYKSEETHIHNLTRPTWQDVEATTTE